MEVPLRQVQGLDRFLMSVPAAPHPLTIFTHEHFWHIITIRAGCCHRTPPCLQP